MKQDIVPFGNVSSHDPLVALCIRYAYIVCIVGIDSAEDGNANRPRNKI